MLGLGLSIPNIASPNKGANEPPVGYRWLLDLDGTIILADSDGTFMMEHI